MCILKKYQKVQSIALTENNVSVFECVDRDTGKNVVIKQLPKDRFSKEFFENECLINQLVIEQSVARIIEKDETNDSFFIVMEAGCCDLFRYIMDNGPIDYKRCMKLFKPIFKTISYMHSQHIIHNDIKLENIVVTDDNRLLLIDFGLSEVLSNEKHSDKYVGTMNYTAPEISQNKPHSYSSDIYSLGVVLFASITGEFPYYAENAYEYQMEQLSGNLNIHLLEEMNIPQHIIKLLTHMLSPNPNDRPTAVECLHRRKRDSVSENAVNTHNL